jgi:hypothetical protein
MVILTLIVIQSILIMLTLTALRPVHDQQSICIGITRDVMKITDPGKASKKYAHIETWLYRGFMKSEESPVDLVVFREEVKSKYRE